MKEIILIVGCNYHTTWQSNKKMRFVLSEVKGNKARLTTRNTKKDFWTNINDLIFIETDYNKRKLEEIERRKKFMEQNDIVNPDNF